MIKNLLQLLLFAIVLFHLSACSDETDPKKAFDNGDYETAFNLWMPLAENGDDEAQNYLGIMYYLGLGVSKDSRKAVEWYQRAAIAGNADAQRNYGDMLNYGRAGLKKDNFQAYKWYFAASQQGNKKAESQIRVIAASGNLSPNQQMHAKIEANEFILDESKRFMSHDTYIDKK
ncbi:MAG: tetratricopeptide repeat protein [Pseudomonadota bacterium]